MKEVGFFKRIWAEALPFVARSPEMKVAWLVEIFNKESLTLEELAPYMHLLISEYSSFVDGVNYDVMTDTLKPVFGKLNRGTVARMIQCVEIYDLPVLLSLIEDLSVDEAILALRKKPPVYEKKSLLVLDKVFQAVNESRAGLLAQAAKKMEEEGDVPEHFPVSYARFKEILHDEKILMALYPQVKT
nr:hypothetical protein [Desulfobulbaceae bacterium]